MFVQITFIFSIFKIKNSFKFKILSFLDVYTKKNNGFKNV